MRHFHTLGTALLFCGCLLALVRQGWAEDEPAKAKAKVQVQAWMAEIDVAKLRTLNLTCEHVQADGERHTVRITDCLEGKEKDAPILQRPDELLALMRDAGVARVLAEPTVVTLDGREALLETGNTKLQTTPTIQDNGRIRLDVRVEHNERNSTGRRRAAQNHQRMLDSSVECESGKTVLISPWNECIAIYPNGKPVSEPAAIIALVRATADPATTIRPVSSVSSPVPAGAVSSAAASVKSLKIHLKVLEVDRGKMNKLGFQWSKPTSEDQKDFTVEPLDSLLKNQPASGDELNGFLQALQQNGLARVLAEPTLLTLDGRPAAFSAGQTTVDFVPILLAGERVKLECRLNAGSSPVQIRDAELELGKFALVRHPTTSDARPARSRRHISPMSQNTEILVLARVDLLKPGEIPAISGPPTYIEVAGKPK
jgi:hypothetical protein